MKRVFRCVNHLPHTRISSTAFFVLLLSFSSTVFAQQGFDPGYIVKQNNDTVKGLIKTAANTDSYGSVSFKTDMSGEWTRYGYSDLLGFGFGNEVFRSIAFLNTANGNTKDTTFARQLVSGTYNLFTFLNGNGRRFFLLQKDTSVNLLYSDLAANLNGVDQAGNYQNFLLFLSLQCDKLKGRNDLVGYNEKSMADFVHEVDNCISGGSSVTYGTKQKVKVTPILFAGGMPVSQHKSLVAASFTIRLTEPRLDNHLSLNFGFNYSEMNYMTKYNKSLNPLYRYYSRENIGSIAVTGQYNIALGRIQPYIYVGVSGNHYSLDNLATGFYVQPNEAQTGAGVVGGAGIEGRIIAGLFLRFDWRYDVLLQYPVIGLSYHF